MAQYPKLNSILARTGVNTDFGDVENYLRSVWMDDYLQRMGNDPVDIVETSDEGFSHLFDAKRGRVVAAWGVRKGKHHGDRNVSRMSARPQRAGNRHHRGHTTVHTLGDGTHIKLVTQKGTVKTGQVQRMNNPAIANPGVLCFTYWEYEAQNSQTPTGVDQGLLIPSKTPDIRHVSSLAA